MAHYSPRTKRNALDMLRDLTAFVTLFLMAQQAQMERRTPPGVQLKRGERLQQTKTVRSVGKLREKPATEAACADRTVGRGISAG